MSTKDRNGRAAGWAASAPGPTNWTATPLTKKVGRVPDGRYALPDRGAPASPSVVPVEVRCARSRIFRARSRSFLSETAAFASGRPPVRDRVSLRSMITCAACASCSSMRRSTMRWAWRDTQSTVGDGRRGMRLLSRPCPGMESWAQRGIVRSGASTLSLVALVTMPACALAASAPRPTNGDRTPLTVESGRAADDSHALALALEGRVPGLPELDDRQGRDNLEGTS